MRSRPVTTPVFSVFGGADTACDRVATRDRADVGIVVFRVRIDATCALEASAAADMFNTDARAMYSRARGVCRRARASDRA